MAYLWPLSSASGGDILLPSKLEDRGHVPTNTMVQSTNYLSVVRVTVIAENC